uniref:Cyclin-dependent kinase 2 homolog n=1 Tax=Hyaloperonospora arabidopsidis (strain Emoy2) TaxID=559515 RepID=M4BPH4_HYAAE
MDASSAPTHTSDSTPLKKRRATTTTTCSRSSSTGVSCFPEPPAVTSDVATTELARGKRAGSVLLTSFENPLLAVLGGTPRSQAVAMAAEESRLSKSGTCEDEEKVQVTDKEEKEVVPRLREESEVQDPLAVSVNKATPSVTLGGLAAPLIGKRKRDDRKQDGVLSDFVAYAREHIHNQEVGEEGFSIDPSERAVEHRASKVVRREILIASPAAYDEEDWEGSRLPQVKMDEVEAVLTPSEHFDLQPTDIILHVFAFLVTAKDLQNMSQVSKKWKELTSRRSLYRSLPSVTVEGSVNWINFKNLGIKNKGTEGTCIKCCQRSTGKILAMKKARVFPKGIKHDHIASLELISLAKDELHVFFPYVDKTLHEVINPTGDPSGGRVLSETVIRKLLHQLLDAIAYCHRRGVLHRDATLQISDFALVRATGIPRRTYTMEVVTLWYRPPEILMGVRGYSSAVDIWSVGCIFAEMAQGKPLFTGISEIDQLFQIFSKLSTPTSETWPGFSSLPNYHFEFPHWKRRPLNRLFPRISDLGIDLLTKLLVYNPDQRITAEDALRHPYFSNEARAFLPLTPKIPMYQMCYTMSRARIGPTPEHVDLFHAYLRQTELESWKEIKYLSRQKTLRPAHRSMLVDWLIEGAR